MNYQFTSAIIAFAGGAPGQPEAGRKPFVRSLSGHRRPAIRSAHRASAGPLRLADDAGPAESARQPRYAASVKRGARRQGHVATGHLVSNDVSRSTMHLLRRRDRAAGHQALRSPTPRPGCSLALSLAGPGQLGPGPAGVFPGRHRAAAPARHTATRQVHHATRRGTTVRLPAPRPTAAHPGRTERRR